MATTKMVAWTDVVTKHDTRRRVRFEYGATESEAVANLLKNAAAEGNRVVGRVYTIPASEFYF